MTVSFLFLVQISEVARTAPALDEEGLPIYDLLIWVGAEHYPYCCDYIEELRRYGASRRLNPNLDLSLLSQSSRMILAHPHVLNTAWQTQCPPQTCKKAISGHDVAIAADDDEAEDAPGEADTEMIVNPLVRPVGTSTGSLLALRPCGGMWQKIHAIFPSKMRKRRCCRLR